MEELINKLKKWGDEIGKEVFGKSMGQKLVDNFAKSLECARSMAIEVTTDEGKKILFYLDGLRKILVSGLNVKTPFGNVSRKEAIIAFIEWKLYPGIKPGHIRRKNGG